MRWIQRLTPLIVIWLLFTHLSSAAGQAALVATPSEITLAAIRNQQTILTRTILLQATNDITNLKIIPLDLIRTDNQTILPAANITTTATLTQLNKDETVSLPITITIDNITSGAYTGTLLFQYSGGAIPIPLTVNIKDAPYFPLVFLIAGIILGLGTSFYLAQGKPRDEILVRMGQLRTEIQTDQELAAAFHSHLQSILTTTDSLLSHKKWKEAAEAIEKGEVVWRRWRRDRNNWLEQISFAHQLLQHNELQATAQSHYLKQVVLNINQALGNAPTFPEGTRDLHKQLNTASDQLNQYLRLQEQISSLGKMPNLDNTQRAQIINFQNRLDGMSPGIDEYNILFRGVAQAREAFAATPLTKDVIGTTRSSGEALPSLVMPQPNIQATIEPDYAIAQASVRLAIFRWGGYIIAIIFLAGAGFTQLYLANATFGSSPWIDYFALAIWGFSAETSRAALTDLLSKFGIPALI